MTIVKHTGITHDEREKMLLMIRYPVCYNYHTGNEDREIKKVNRLKIEASSQKISAILARIFRAT